MCRCRLFARTRPTRPGGGVQRLPSGRRQRRLPLAGMYLPRNWGSRLSITPTDAAGLLSTRSQPAFVSMTEAGLERWLLTWCRAHEIICWKAGGPVGVPDRILHYKGHTLYIELKSPSGRGRLSRAQRYWMQKLMKAGIPCVAADDKAGCIAAIETYLFSITN